MHRFVKPAGGSVQNAQFLEELEDKAGIKLCKSIVINLANWLPVLWSETVGLRTRPV